MNRLSILLFFSLLLFPLSGFSQKKNDAAHAKTGFSGDSAVLRKLYETKYSKAVELDDPEQIMNSIYDLYSIAPHDTQVTKKMATVYFNTKKFEQSYLLARQNVETYRDDIFFLEIYAKSAEFLGRGADAVLQYKKLQALTGYSAYGYLAAFQEWLLGRYPECEASLNALISAPDATTTTVSIAAENSQQNVPVIAAIYNLQAMLYNKTGRRDDALKACQQALDKFPDFKAARINLGLLTDAQAPAK